MQWRNSCKVAIAAKSDTPVSHNLLGSCQSEFRVLDLSATSGTHALNPSIEKSTLNALNVTQIYSILYPNNNPNTSHMYQIPFTKYG